MKKKSSVIISVLLMAAIVFGLVYGMYKIKNTLIIKDYPVMHETEFGGVYIKITIDDFNNFGFQYGDSVDVKFSNGYELLDIPYYNGYYVDMDEPLLVGYPGYNYIKLAVNYGEDLWYTAELEGDETVIVSLHERNKYINIQKLRDIHYEDEQGDTPDAVFANFRNVKVGNVKENMLYRSASPVDNTHKRAPVVDKLAQEANIKYILDLSDEEEDIEEYIEEKDFNSPYFLSLYNEDKVYALGMSMQFNDEYFQTSLAKGLTAVANNEGPYLIHCQEGKDRTGFVLMVIEGLLGATYQEIVDDYMLTYKNYYSITETSDSERYEIIKEKNIDVMLRHILNDEEKDLSKADYQTVMNKYLFSIGMRQDDINKLIEKLSNKKD